MELPEEGTRLNKFIASHLKLGRRAADELITKGKVFINGELPILGARVTPGDEIIVAGKKLDTAATPKFIYVALHKPINYVCSRRQQGDTPTIYQLLPEKYQHLKPVGRLDKDTSGLIILTNDGTFAHQLTHPSFAKRKQYHAVLDKPLAPLHRQMINDFGINLTDGKSLLQLARIKDGDEHRWHITMSEGRNRQIRRTFAALGYTVIALHRTDFGRLSLGQLEPGKYQEVAKSSIS